MEVSVNVLIPTYNVEKYIKECLESVLNQTFQNFDIIIIDDCSTDNTITVIESLNESRVKIIKKKENKGLIDSLNIGFKACTAKYIARVDGDDINDLTRFEKQFKFLENNSDIDACGSWLQSFGYGNRLIKHKETHDEIMCAMLLNNPMSLGATMLRTKKYENIVFDDAMIHAEDYDLWARTGFFNKMHNLQEVLYKYRIHKEQICSNYQSVQFEKKEQIKLRLFKKINYNQELYTDEFLIKMLFSNQVYSKCDFVLLKNWQTEMFSLNKNQSIYNQKNFKLALQKIISGVLKSTYTSYRRGHSGMDKLKLLSVLPLKWKFLGFCSLVLLKIKIIIQGIK